MKFIAAFLLVALSTLAHAQPFPGRPVTLIVPFSPGTGIDILARVIAPRLSEMWRQPVVVENKAGASGNIGTDFVAKSDPDGHTLMVTVNTFAITPSLIRNTPYDVVHDFTPVSKIATATYCFDVNPKVFPAKDMKEAVAMMRTNPGKYFFASPGNGTPHHIGMELLKLRLVLGSLRVARLRDLRLRSCHRPPDQFLFLGCLFLRSLILATRFLFFSHLFLEAALFLLGALL